MVRSNGVMLVHWLARRSFASSVPSSPVYWWVFGGRYRTFKTGVSHNSSVLVGNYTNTNNVCKKSWLLGTLSTGWLASRSIHGTAKTLHPDTNKDDPETEKKIQEVQKAYEVLKYEEKRRSYDEIGDENPDNGFPRNPFEDIFDKNIFNIFRQNGGQDIKVTLELSFMEAVQGCAKTVSFQAAVVCEACGGSGVPPGTRRESCKRCKGSGMTFMQTGPFRVQTTCSQCGGTGVDDNETIKVYSSGGADPDGMQPGDLYVTIKVREDPVFRREGANVHVDAVLSITQAILGGTIQVPTLTGDVVLKVRAGTQPGQKVVLKKKGIKTRNSYSLGDQYVHFNVSIPTNLTKRQRELIEEFGKEEEGEYGKCAAAGAS